MIGGETPGKGAKRNKNQSGEKFFPFRKANGVRPKTKQQRPSPQYGIASKAYFFAARPPRKPNPEPGVLCQRCSEKREDKTNTSPTGSNLEKPPKPPPRPISSLSLIKLL